MIPPRASESDRSGFHRQWWSWFVVSSHSTPRDQWAMPSSSHFLLKSASSVWGLDLSCWLSLSNRREWVSGENIRMTCLILSHALTIVLYPWVRRRGGKKAKLLGDVLQPGELHAESTFDKHAGWQNEWRRRRRRRRRLFTCSGEEKEKASCFFLALHVCDSCTWNWIALFFLWRTVVDYEEKMLVEITLLAGLGLCGFLLYQAAHYYARRSLAFSPLNHEPMYIPGASSSTFPMVCVLGWGGCTRRQLRRLLDFYSSHGIATISWINPMGDYLFGVDRQQVERVLDLLLHRDQRSNGIVIHLHSNNGALVWSRMLGVMTNDKRYSSLLNDVNGIILDSAPFVQLDESSEWILGTAFGVSRPCVSIILNRAQYVHWFWTPVIIYYIAIRLAYQRYMTSEVSTSLKQIRDSLNATPAQITQYYLYSHADLLIPYRTIGTWKAWARELSSISFSRCSRTSDVHASSTRCQCHVASLRRLWTCQSFPSSPRRVWQSRFEFSLHAHETISVNTRRRRTVVSDTHTHNAPLVDSRSCIHRFSSMFNNAFMNGRSSLVSVDRSICSIWLRILICNVCHAMKWAISLLNIWMASWRPCTASKYLQSSSV